MLDKYLISIRKLTIKYKILVSVGKDVSKLLLVLNHVFVWGNIHILKKLAYIASKNVK